MTVDTTTAEHRVLEMFAAVCADPDSPDVAAAADEALAEVDRMLAVGAAPRPSRRGTDEGAIADVAV